MEKREETTSSIATSTCQNNSDILDKQNVTSSSSNLFHELIEKQAKKFEEFGIHMSTQLRTSYQEYIKQDELKIENNFEKVCESLQTMIDSQSKLINSLESRIEELETDSAIKDQDIKKLRTKFLELKLTKTGVNESNLGSSNDTVGEETKRYWADDTIDLEDNFYSKSSNKTHVESFTSNNVSSSSSSSLSQLEKIHERVQQIITERDDKKFKRKHVKVLVHNFAKNDLIRYTNSTNFNSLDEKVRRLINNLIRDISEDGKLLSKRSRKKKNKNRANEGEHSNSVQGDSANVSWEDNLEDVRAEQLHIQIQQIITRQENHGFRIRLKHFKTLRQFFTIDDFIQYTNTNKFNSLDDDSKRLLRLLIYESLSEDIDRRNELSQNLEEYVKRGIIPLLPLGCDNYTMYEKSNRFNTLSPCLKKRVRKIIHFEKSQEN